MGKDSWFRTPTIVVIHIGTNVSSELETDKGEGIWEKVRFAAKQLDDRVNFQNACVSVDEYSELPTPPEHDQALVDKS